MVAQSLLLNLTMAKNTVLHRFSKHYITPTPKCKTDFNCFCLGVLT